MNPDEKRYTGIFDHLKGSLDLAKKKCATSQSGSTQNRISKLLDETMRYVHFEGAPGIIQALIAQAED